MAINAFWPKLTRITTENPSWKKPSCVTSVLPFCGSSSSDEEKTVAKDLSAALEKIRLLEITVEEEKKKAKARKLMDSEWLRSHCTDAQCSRLTSLPTVKSFFAFHKYLTADGLFGLSVMPPRLADLDDDDDDDDGDLGDSDVGSAYDGASPNFSADSGSDDGADADAGADAGAVGWTDLGVRTVFLVAVPNYCTA